jgi:prephenate dehydrogenase
VTVGIVGAGLIGRSVALAARRAAPQTRVVTVDRGDDLGAVAGAELIILATPVDVIIELLRNGPSTFGDAVVTDVGSTKRDIVHAARFAGLTTFVAGHPMAGAASSGPSAARADLFDGRTWFLVPDRATPSARATVRGFVERLGARPMLFDDDGAAHDRLLASISHLPQVAASVLMNIVGDSAGPDGLPLAGPGCRDTTRLAGSSAAMWESVLATNAPALRPLLLAMADQLRDAADKIDDAEYVRRLFGAANEYRRQLERS